MTRISELFSARVPRYTSYPTAPHFRPDIDGGIYRSWLEDLPPEATLSLYVHVPFCDTLCRFCGCHTTVVNRYAPVAAYVELLLQEISLVAKIAALGRAVTHVHWGGGSPTILRPDDIRRLGSALRESFTVATDAEFAIEIDPRGFNADTATALAEIGVSRASVGVQDCDLEVQRVIDRIQPMSITAEAIATLREAGIDRLNVDLIYGLPHQSVDGVRRTIDAVWPLDPDRLAIFGYAHVPHFKRHQSLIPEDALPDIDLRFQQAETARNRLREFGYEPIGLDHFAKPGDSMAVAQKQGRLARNFQGYTTDNAQVLIGLGASSIGALPQGYIQNIAGVPGYRASLMGGRLPIARGILLSDEDRARRAIIERLMCDLTVDLDSTASNFGVSRAHFADALSNLEPLVREGIVSVKDGLVAIGEPWRAATRLVCAAFDQYLNVDSARHASAI